MTEQGAIGWFGEGLHHQNSRQGLEASRAVNRMISIEGDVMSCRKVWADGKMRVTPWESEGCWVPTYTTLAVVFVIDVC